MMRSHTQSPLSLGLDLLRATEFGLGGAAPHQPQGPRVTGRVGADAIEVRAEVPGHGPGDLELTLEGTTLHLTLLGEPHADTGEREKLHEGTLRLPYRVDADSVEATFRHGLLEVVLHRLRPERRAIPVQSAE